MMHGTMSLKYEGFVRLAGRTHWPVRRSSGSTLGQEQMSFWSIQTYGSKIIARYMIDRSQPHSVSDTRNH